MHVEGGFFTGRKSFVCFFSLLYISSTLLLSSSSSSSSSSSTSSSLSLSLSLSLSSSTNQKENQNQSFPCLHTCMFLLWDLVGSLDCVTGQSDHFCFGFMTVDWKLLPVVVVWLCSSALLSPESLLTNLFPDDDGGKAPNPSSLYQLAKVG